LRNRTATSTAKAVRRHRPMYQIVLYMGLLLMLGLVVMYALGPQRANVLNHTHGANYSDTFFFNKQLASVITAVVAFGVAAILPYRWLTEAWAKRLFIAGLAACFLLVVCGALLHLPFASDTNGAYRWFYLGGLGSFQPAELLKFGLLLFVAGFLAKRVRQGKLNDINETLIPLGIVMAVSMFVVVVLQKDLGTGVSLVALALSVLAVSGMDARLLRRIVFIIAAAALVLTFSSPHRIERVMTFIQGDTHQSVSRDENNYHIQQARIAIGSGGLLGLGIGKSVQATGYLPEAINDSIFAVMGETFGFVGLSVILALFSALLLSLLKVTSRLADMHLRLVVAGVFGWVASHVLMNIGSMTGIIPMTGISLPLLSYGGTSMLFIAAALGLAFQLSGYTAHKPLMEGEGSGKDLGGRRRLGRTRYASRGSV
jgi:bacterial cell division membrane protein